MSKQKQDWLYKKYDVDGWLHKIFYFSNDTEFVIFLVWALYVSVFFLSF